MVPVGQQIWPPAAILDFHRYHVSSETAGVICRNLAYEFFSMSRRVRPKTNMAEQWSYLNRKFPYT